MTLRAVGDHRATFAIDGETYETAVKLEGVYNLYNAAAALAVVRAVMQDNAAASKATAAANACAVSADELIAATVKADNVVSTLLQALKCLSQVHHARHRHMRGRTGRHLPSGGVH